jgi:hypothetical protein
MNRIVLLCLLCFPVFLFAGGAEEKVQKEVNGLENWHTDINLDEFENKSEYNLLIRAFDKAGNEGVAGPYTIRVDSDSDIPQTYIKSPFEGMRTDGKLNVLGTAVDDDGISYVEVRLGEDGEIFRADGTQYWSFFLDDLPNEIDGKYEIQARAVDINGTPNEEWTKVSFYLDQFAPKHSIENIDMGTLVTGNLRLEGTVEELNGIQSVQWRMAEDDEWRTLSYNYNQDKELYSFVLETNTQNMEDGPHVIWFRSTNELGIRGESPFLFFSDNTAPQITLLGPTEEKRSKGEVNFVGMIQDAIGVESLTYFVNENMQGDIPLSPGNPFWTLDLDFSGETVTEKRIRFTALDATGNTLNEDFRFFLDPEGDRPTLEVASPLAGEQYKGVLPLRGWANDDDQVVALYYQQGAGEPIKVETNGAFNFDLPVENAGAQRLILFAEDEHGVQSLKTEIPFTFVPNAPTIALQNANGADGGSQYFPGVLFPGKSKTAESLSGVVNTIASLKSLTADVSGQRPISVSYKPVPGSGQYSFTLPVDPSWGLGTHYISLKAVDQYDQESILKGFFLIKVVDLMVDGGQDPDYVPPTEDFFHFVDSRIEETGRVVLDPALPMEGLFYTEVGFTIQQIELDPPTELVQITPTETSIGAYSLKIEAKEEGVAEATRIKVTTTEGNSFYSEAYTFVTDLSPPQINVEAPVMGQWIDRFLELTLSIAEAGSVGSVEYSLDGVTYKDLTALEAQANDDGTSTYSLDLAAYEDGNQTLFLRAADAGGMSATIALPFFKDTQEPALSQITPLPNMSIDGLTTVVFESSEKHIPVSASYLVQVPETEETAVESSMNELIPGRVFFANIDFSTWAETPSMTFTATDRAGNQGTIIPNFVVDLEKDKPQVSIQVPAEQETLRADFFISGLVTDDDAVASIFYRIDEEEFQKADGTNSFSIPVRLSEISDAPHVVQIYAEDINGTRSDIISRNFVVSSSGPISQLESPDLNNTQTGKITLRGNSEDPNGVERVWVSLDNGTTYALMEGAEQWSYDFDTTILADGLYSIIVRAEDTTGAFGDYNLIFFVDNTAPTISLVNPKDGQEYTNFFPLEGRGNDNLELQNLKYLIRNLETRSVADQGILPVNGGFTQMFDASSFEPGLYNIELEAEDNAGNLTYAARNIQIQTVEEHDSLDIYFPAEGQRISGPLEIEGLFKSQDSVRRIALYVNDQVYTTFEANESGFFNRLLEASEMEQIISEKTKEYGVYETIVLYLQVEKEDGTILKSPARRIEYTQQGAWLTVDSHSIGDMISGRPYLEGRAGFFGLEVLNKPLETITLEEGEDTTEENGGLTMATFGQDELTLKEVHEKPPVITISRDNGLSYQPVAVWRMDNPENLDELRGVYNWRMQLETPDYPQGDLNLLVRAVYGDGSVLTTRQILKVDKQLPRVSLLEPDEGGSFNQTLELIGSASDNFDLEKVEAVMWQGFNREYQTSGLSGLYLEGNFFSTGGVAAGAIGGSALDGLAKIQLGASYMPSTFVEEGETKNTRFFGYNYQAKLIINLLTSPVSELPLISTALPGLRDFDNVVLSGGVGASFTLFSMDAEEFWSEDFVVVPAALVQTEFKLVTGIPVIESLAVFHEFSWSFISSDVEATILPKWQNFGVRLQVF